MIRKMLGTLGAVGLVAVGALALSATPARAGGGHNSFAFSYTYSSGGYYPRHYYPRHYYYPPPRRVVYVAPPPVIYAPPRVVYTQPPVVYAPAPPVVQQTLPGGPLASNAPYCREYQATTVVNGRQVPTYGTACQQPDGSWQIVR
jgi:hypothetical protein